MAKIKNRKIRSANMPAPVLRLYAATFLTAEQFVMVSLIQAVHQTEAEEIATEIEDFLETETGHEYKLETLSQIRASDFEFAQADVENSIFLIELPAPKEKEVKNG